MCETNIYKLLKSMKIISDCSKVAWEQQQQKKQPDGFSLKSASFSFHIWEVNNQSVETC